MVTPENHSASDHNQCDGCRQGAPVNGSGNHVNSSGAPFMSCQRKRYEGPSALDAATAQLQGLPPAALNTADQLLRAIADYAAHCIIGDDAAADSSMDGIKQQVASLLAPPTGLVKIEGLGRMTNEDFGFLTLQFKDEDAAQAFMQQHECTVEVDELPDIDPFKSDTDSDQVTDHPALVTILDDILTPQGLAKYRDNEKLSLDGEVLRDLFTAGLDARQPAVPELEDDQLDVLHDSIERKVNAEIRADLSSTGGARVERRMYMRKLMRHAARLS